MSKRALGLLEFKSVAKGIEVLDEVLKSSNVELMMANPICPGKYIGIITGEVAAVSNGIKVGENLGGVFLIEAIVISSLHEAVIPAMLGSNFAEINDAIGIVETMSALGAIQVADIAIKASNIQLVEVRVARGLGGKGFTIFTGEISSVKNASAACKQAYRGTGEILCSSVLATPNKRLIQSIL